LKETLAADSVAGNTFTGMLTRLTFRKPFHVGLGGMVTVYRRGEGSGERGDGGEGTSQI
jgi:hypothetical protein